LLSCRLEDVTMMNQEIPLPSVFGRLTNLLSEHERLAGTLAQVRAMCLALEAGHDVLAAGHDPRQLIGLLRFELSRHFDAEESPAHFGTVAAERPDLLAEVVELKIEHLVMLETMGDLALMAEDEARWSELPAPALALLETLRAHERAESELVRGFIAGKRRF